MFQMTNTILFAYDVMNDSKRRKIHTKLSEYLFPIQKSVFYGQLTESQKVVLLESIQAFLEPTDSLIVVSICKQCEKYIELQIGKNKKMLIV